MAAVTTMKQLTERLAADYRRLAVEAFKLRQDDGGSVVGPAQSLTNTQKAVAIEGAMTYINDLREAVGEPEIEVKVELEGGKPVLYEKQGWRKVTA